MSHRFSTFTIDNTAPAFSGTLTISSANADGTANAGNAGIGDTITVNFTLNEAQISTSKPTVSLQTSGGGTITVPDADVSDVTPVTGTGRTAWRAVYTVQASGGAVTAYSGTVNRLDVTATDAAGNSSTITHTYPSSGVTITIDNTAPTLSITGASAPAIKSSPAGTDDTKVTAGDRAEVTFTASDTGSGISRLSTQVVFTVGGNTLSGTVTRIGTTNNYRARTRPLTASDLTFQGTMTATVRVFDNFGNSHAVTPTAVTGSVTVDTVAPTFTPGLTFNPAQPPAGYTAPQNITIEVRGVSSDAASVTFRFNSTDHSATKVAGTTNTWRTASVAVPASIGGTTAATYPVDVKVVDGHGNETNTANAGSIKVQ